MDEQDFQDLVSRLRELKEREWIEFKQNKDQPEMIGRYISALANSAALDSAACGFVVWGLDNSGEPVGTVFNHRTAKGNGEEPLEIWLIRQVEPRPHLKFLEGLVAGKRIVVLQIPAASINPVSFAGKEYVRIGEVTQELKAHRAKEEALWRIFSAISFENELSGPPVPAESIPELLKIPELFSLLRLPEPTSLAQTMDRLLLEKLLTQQGAGRYGVTNLAALLFATNLSKFERLSRKAIRMIEYRNTTKIDRVGETEGILGYAVGFQGLNTHLKKKLTREVMDAGIRKSEELYPLLALRELAANALIHQDFTLTGTGPMIEIFANRIEFTNPGAPLVDVRRLLDAPPRSRNEKLATLMRRMGICEEAGTGIDKVIHLIESQHLPPLIIETPEGFTRLTLFRPRSFHDLTRDERIVACYQHTSLLYVSKEKMTNSSLKVRLGLPENASHTSVSKIIADAISANLVKPFDPSNKSKKSASYVPFWA